MLQRVTPWLAGCFTQLFFPVRFSVCCTFTVSSQPSFPPGSSTHQESDSATEKGEAHGIRNTAVARRYGSRHREQLALVQTPAATRSFKPVPHIELINTLEHVLKLNQITIRKEQFALRRDGATLFGVLLLAYQDTPDGMAALGLRTSNIARCRSNFARDYRCLSATTWSSAGT